MRLISSLSLRTRALAVASLAVGLFLINFLHTYHFAGNTTRSLQQIEDQTYQVLKGLSELGNGLLAIRTTLERSLLEQDASYLDDAARLADAWLRKVDDVKRLDPEIEPDAARVEALFNHAINSARHLTMEVIAAEGLSGHLLSFYETSQQLQEDLNEELDVLYQAQLGRFHGQVDVIRAHSASAVSMGVYYILFCIGLLVFLTYRVSKGVVQPLNHAVHVATDIAEGKWDTEIQQANASEAGRLLQSIAQMRDALKARRDADLYQEAINRQLAALNESLRGDMAINELGDNLLKFLASIINFHVGAFYLYESDKKQLVLMSTYALDRRKHLAQRYELGESLVGQCALEKKPITLTQVPGDYLPVTSATGSGTPANVMVLPIIYEGGLKAVLELGALNAFSEADENFINESVRLAAVTVHTAESRLRLDEALRQSQQQAEELENQKLELSRANDDLEGQAMELAASESRLQQQQEELKAINEELEEQAKALKESEESLQAQQEELRVTNEELEAQAKILSEQKTEMGKKNKVLEDLHSQLEDKIKELELSSKYKSEFLSTMSHELRTPLNSILILSNSLAQNKKGNLEDKQIEHAQVIHSAGSDLLSLINDILDISKIEEGKMNIVIDDIHVDEFVGNIQRSFSHIAENKGITFIAEKLDPAPERFFTDRQRVDQVVKNLLSNAIKFTEDGGTVRVAVGLAAKEEIPLGVEYEQVVKIAVTDSGIGISPEKQRLVFEAFQQADGTTSRKYGGTGLGLTISRELARLLGGEVGLYSEGAGKGTTFTLYLPVGDEQTAELIQSTADTDRHVVSSAETAPKVLSAERDKTVLIIEDDEAFARVLVELAADFGLDAHVCPDGETGLEFLSVYRPTAVLLDIGLPGMDGWEVMAKIKENPNTRDVPVHFLSGKNEKSRAMALGAVDFLVKPVSGSDLENAFKKIEAAADCNVRRLLLVEDSLLQVEGIRTLFEDKSIDIVSVHTGADAVKALENNTFDCMILDLTLPDINGLELLEQINESRELALPVIVYTGKELSREEEARLRKYADRIILKTEKSSERLLSEASLFLHWLESTVSNQKASQATTEHRDHFFQGKRLLLVDDDMRNIYALSAQLEEMGFEIEIANNGREAVDTLEASEQVFDIVLMDIMMPEMDGYEAMRLIRSKERFKKLPILALTAKAMKDDRAKCLEAGANDYCSKPIDMEKLTSLMRVWLQR